MDRSSANANLHTSSKMILIANYSEFKSCCSQIQKYDLPPAAAGLTPKPIVQSPVRPPLTSPKPQPVVAAAHTITKTITSAHVAPAVAAPKIVSPIVRGKSLRNFICDSL